MTTRAIIAILIAAAATPAVAKIAPVPAATPIGKPISCVRLADIRESRVRSDQVIDFYMRDGRIYRNTVPNSCPQLGFEEAFSYRVTTGQLCSIDVIRVFDRSVRRPGISCGLGQFQPVTVVGH